tara:strand:- start:4411 stop:5175 length:765 start_codon:yes stop_codon:yes gene_type:complete
VTTEYIKDNLEEYRNLSDTAFKRSFERDKVLLREMGYSLDYKNDKWSIEEGYNITGTNIVNKIKNNPKIDFNDFINTYHLIKNNVNSKNENLDNLSYISKLTNAIYDKKRVSFDYNNKLRKVYPMGIKYHNNSWYLGAEENKYLKTFKLQSIRNLKIGNKSDLHDKSYKTINFSWEDNSNLIKISIYIQKEQYVIYKNLFNHSVSSRKYIDNTLELDLTTYDMYGLLKFLLLSNPKKIKLDKKSKTSLLELLNE